MRQPALDPFVICGVLAVFVFLKMGAGCASAPAGVPSRKRAAIDRARCSAQIRTAGAVGG